MGGGYSPTIKHTKITHYFYRNIPATPGWIPTDIVWYALRTASDNAAPCTTLADAAVTFRAVRNCGEKTLNAER
jgi:hypothetical protein